MSAVLMIIDMQQGGRDPSLGTCGQPQAEINAGRLLKHWREHGYPVIHIRHDDTNPESPYAPENPGHAFMPEVAPLPHEEVVDKRTTNAFVGTDLMQVLEAHGSTQIVVCGMHLEHCVGTTARMAGNLGFMVYLAADATASLSSKGKDGQNWTAEEVHALTLAVLDGDYVKVSETDTLIALASRPADHPTTTLQ